MCLCDYCEIKPCALRPTEKERRTVKVIGCPHYKNSKPTNADRIRAMSDEELAEYIDLVAEACYSAGAEDLPLSNSNPLSNAYNILEWLKQPAEEEPYATPKT